MRIITVKMRWNKGGDLWHMRGRREDGGFIQEYSDDPKKNKRKFDCPNVYAFFERIRKDKTCWYEMRVKKIPKPKGAK